MAEIGIIGAGIAGLALARALRQSGLVGVRVFDASDDKSRATRQLSMNPGSIAFLERIGAWPEEAAATFHGMEVWDGMGTASLELPATGAIIESAALVAALAEDQSVSWGKQLVRMDQSETIDLEFADGDTHQCDLLVGADGGQSMVRQLAGLRSVGWQYDQQAIVATVTTEIPHGQVARQCFTDSGPLAFLPLAGPNQCSLVWSSTRADALLALDEAAFCTALTKEMGSRTGTVTGVSVRHCFPLRQQHSLQYSGERVVIIGDAAHTIHPLAGQGANLGLGDAAALAAAILDAAVAGRDVGDTAVCNQYRLARQPYNTAVAALMEAFKQGFSPAPPGLAWLRNTGMRLLNQQDWLKAQIVALASA